MNDLAVFPREVYNLPLLLKASAWFLAEILSLCKKEIVLFSLIKHMCKNQAALHWCICSEVANQAITGSQNGLGWKSPQSPSNSNLLPWAVLPTTGSGCPEPYPTWAWTPPVMGHPQLLWATCYSTSPLVKNVPLTSNLKLPCFNLKSFLLLLSLSTCVKS